MMVKGKRDKEHDIMQAAYELFKEKGIEKTSIRDIMKRSGYGLGTFYLYYKDKNDLKEKLVLYRTMAIVSEAEAASSGDDIGLKYISFIDNIFNYFIENPFELELISKNTTWALYAKVEKDKRLKEEADTTLKYILDMYEELFSFEYTEAQKLYILALSIEVLISTCESTMIEDTVIKVEDVKPVLFELITRIIYSKKKIGSKPIEV